MNECKKNHFKTAVIENEIVAYLKVCAQLKGLRKTVRNLHSGSQFQSGFELDKYSLPLHFRCSKLQNFAHMEIIKYDPDIHNTDCKFTVTEI
jgi:hypothetical protein